MSMELADIGGAPEKKKWFARTVKDAVVGGALGAVSSIPGVGAFAVGIVQEMRNTFAKQQAEEALAAVRAELIERVDKQDAETAARVEGYVNSPEFVNAVLWPALEAVVRAQEQAKVDAAVGFSVNLAMRQGRVDGALREFVAAFLRDATVLDIRALLSLPRSGGHFPPHQIATKAAIPHLDNLFNKLSLGLRLSGPADEGLLQGTLGRLAMLGLCVTLAGSNGRISPIQRTQLGDAVAELITREVA